MRRRAVSDATTLANVSYLEVGGSVTSAFAGVGGIGFNLTGVRFGIVMVSDTKGTPETSGRRQLHGVKGGCGQRGLGGDLRSDGAGDESERAGQQDL